MAANVPHPQNQSGSNHRRNRTSILPDTAITSFSGRERELRAVTRLISDPAVRLLTLTGPGGVGKTRLAIHVAREAADAFPGGTWFVPLAPVHDGALVPSAISQGVGIQESGQKSFIANMAIEMSEGPALLVLDNFEHIVQAAPLVTEMLTACPLLTCLVTSRVVLQVSGEHAFPVPPLALPPATTEISAEFIARSPAVGLFLDRARAVRPDFALTNENAADIEQICRRMDGVPLAIELAAARLRYFSLDELKRRIADAASGALGTLNAGPRDVPARQRTLRDAIDWSVELLSTDEQAILSESSVFVGGFTRAAATAVISGHGLSDQDIEEGLDSLVDHSLLQSNIDPDGTMRYSMLETVREYGLERLSNNRLTDATRRRHAEWCVDRVRWQWNELLNESLMPYAWFAWADAEQGNVRAALAWAIEAGDVESATWLAGGFHWRWEYRGLLREGAMWLDQVLALDGDAPALARSWALEGKGALAGLHGDQRSGIAYLGESLALNRSINDLRSVTRSLLYLGILHIDCGDYAVAIELLRESMSGYDVRGSTWGAALAQAHIGSAYFGLGELDLAEAELRSAWTKARESNDAVARFVAPFFMGLVACAHQRAASAARWFKEVLLFYGDDDGIVIAWHRDPDGAARGLAGIAVLAGLVGLPLQATCLLGAAKQPQERIGLVFALPEEAVFSRLTLQLREELGEAAFEQAWERGYRRSPADLIADIESIFETATGDLHLARAEKHETLLTEREQQVLRLIAGGRSDREIGDTLFISHRTVNKHVANILAKLDVASRSEAAVRAVRDQLIE